MRSSGWTTRRRSAGKVAAALVAATTLIGMSGGDAASAAPAAATPAAATPAGPSFDGYPDGQAARDVDNRAGAAAPSVRQRSLAGRLGSRVQFNTLGTPRALGTGKALATGLAADPETAARQYLTQNRELFGFDEKAVANMDSLGVNKIGAGAVVLLRQRFGDLPAAHDGLVAVLVDAGAVVRVTSSLSRDTSVPEPSTISADTAVQVALRDAGLAAEQVGSADVRQVALPTPADGPRAAYEVALRGTDATRPVAFTTYVDGRTGAVLVRDDLVDFDSDNPRWAVYPATPPASGADQRVQWCLKPGAGCAQTVHDPVSGGAWDLNLATGAPTFTSQGNSVNDVVAWGGGTPSTNATTDLARNYTFPLTDQWHQARCNPATFTSPQRIDADAAITNLFAMHNRMHDWAYFLGFTEATWNMQVVNLSPNGLGGDAEQGRAQQNALGGSRNNANQGTPRDGLQPTTNMFLWQPVAGTAYPPCVDGDYDMTVIAHEFTHAISNRMIAGPDTGISGFQGGSMGESWSDLDAAEYLFENGFRAPGDTPFVTGAYVTGSNSRGIRNYDFSKSPLNFSDLGYNTGGPEVHADGEIWSATNLRIRTALVKRYGAGTPATQLACAEGRTSVQSCPGNRRWIQLMFDSFLLQATGQVSMIDMRDNMLAADLVRFGGANQDLLWGAFAESGLGQDAVTAPADTDPPASFASPFADNATVRLAPVGDSAGAAIRLYVGDYEARAVPVADTDPETALPDTFQIVPNTKFQLTAVGAGFGHHKFSTLFLPGRAQDLRLNLPRNLASGASGATITGDGVNLTKIGDDSEATDWASLDGVAGKQVTVDLPGDQPQLVNEVNVSAMVRPAIVGDADAGPQNLFSAARSFAILSCNAALADCTQDTSYQVAFTSAPDAFPGGAFRPFSPELNLRSFHLPPTTATHLRLRILTSQCTGNPLYAGEQDADPAAATDCTTASPAALQVRVAEFQVFTR
jgi:extracellular elastinolytic metalloproteinase